MKSHSGYISVTLRDFVELEVSYNYDYDAGVHTYSNGDPGYPPSSELEITEVCRNGVDYIPVLERFNKIYPAVDIFNELEEEVIDNMDDDCYEPDFDYDDYRDLYDC